jgi:hypothetical protein
MMVRLMTGFLFAIAALGLTLRIGHCQDALVPEIVPLYSPLPANTEFYVDAYFLGTQYGIFEVDVQGNVITASYSEACPSACPTPYYGVHPLTIPALDAGSYALNIVYANAPTQLIAQLPLDIGDAASAPPAPQLLTVPSTPVANQPFILLGFFGLPEGPVRSAIRGGASVSGNVITAPVETGCGFLCPPDIPLLSYGPFQNDVPALAPGVYTVNFIDPSSPGTVVAQFSVVIQGATATAAPAPALGFVGLCLLVLSLALTGYVRAYRHGKAGAMEFRN